MCRIAEQLSREGVNLQMIGQDIDTSDVTGRLLFNMLGAIAQLETDIRAERQGDGIRKAKARRVLLGPGHKLSADQIAELRQRRKSGLIIKTLMREYGLSKTSVYRYLVSAKDAEWQAA